MNPAIFALIGVTIYALFLYLISEDENDDNDSGRAHLAG